jgi:hypothetical protein
MKGIWKYCLGLFVLGAFVATPAPSRAANEAAAAFAQLKTLVGQWEAVTEDGSKATLTYELVSKNSVVVEKAFQYDSGKPVTMISMFFLDGEHLMLTHYCEAHNQPTLRAEDFTPEGTITFGFVSGTNMPSSNIGHMDHVVYKFTDADHFTTVWTFRQNNKDIFTEVLHFGRKR